ncbi:MAG: hypothetical protein ACLQOO_13150 [Terriglobia bacterium]
MIAYLVGDLPDEVAAELEHACFSDDSLFATICAVERELIHAYLRGSLTGPRRERFEAAYLQSPARARRLGAEREWFEAARLMSSTNWRGAPRILSGAVRKLFRGGSPALRFALVSAPVLAALAFGWLAVQSSKLERELQILRADSAARAAQAQPSLAFVLAPGATRGAEGSQRLVIPPNTTRVELDLYLADTQRLPVYRAIILTADGGEVWSSILAPTGNEVKVLVPAAALPRQDYKLLLQAPGANGPTVASYVFGVERR